MLKLLAKVFNKLAFLSKNFLNLLNILLKNSGLIGLLVHILLN